MTVLIGEVSLHATDGFQGDCYVYQVPRLLDDLHAFRIDSWKEVVDDGLLRPVDIVSTDDVTVDKDVNDVNVALSVARLASMMKLALCLLSRS